MILNAFLVVGFASIYPSLLQAALADRDDKSQEMAEDQEIRNGNQQASMEFGPADSHEAMNNRKMINPKIREKRSYEFLMGLINNNSRYEVTKVDPSAVTEQPKVTTENIAGSELLLELMVRIAAHPDRWDKVHKLLRKIEQDLETSRHIVNNLERDQQASGSDSSYNSSDKKAVAYKNERKNISDSASMQLGLENRENRETSRLSVGAHNSSKKALETYADNNKWPVFPEEESGLRGSSVKFVNNNRSESHNGWQAQNKSNANKGASYPKNFSYHRVTGKPIFLNKTPKAYIAVSVIAPKPIRTRTSPVEEVVLENELHQLKPWTHSQNLKDMASLRSRWLIQTDKDKTKPSATS